jgi:hypothetical protein
MLVANLADGEGEVVEQPAAELDERLAGARGARRRVPGG